MNSSNTLSAPNLPGVQGMRVFLAPMAGVSDMVMRSISLQAGADIAYGEMVSAKGLSYASAKTEHLLALAPGEQELGVQIFGHEPAIMASEAAHIEDMLGAHLFCIDINMGCPARKIISKGDGAALMNDPALAESIVAQVKRAVTCPVSVKFRRGFAMGDETAPAFAARMEDAGADFIVVHGRFARQMYTGVSDVGAIRKVKHSVSIPVIGNGDIVDAESARTLIDACGCDAIMIGRGARGNPWIFEQVLSMLEGYRIPDMPGAHERIEAARTHAHLLNELLPEHLVRMRKHGAWYVSGLKGASLARRAFNTCTTIEDFDRVFDELHEQAAS